MRNATTPKGPAAKYLFVMVALLLVGVIYPVAAQEPTPIPAVLVETDEGIVFYGLDNTNELEEVGRLPPEFVISGSQQKDQWALRTEFGENNVTLSPDHQSLAFTARSFGPPVWVKLFIYDLQNKQVREGFSGVFDTASESMLFYDFALYWSPDNQKLLTNSHRWCCENPYDPMPEMYVYDIPNSAWWAITNTPDRLEWEPVWSSNSENIAYNTLWDEIRLVDWEGNQRRLLTKQDSSVCDFTWSEAKQRWYYVMSRCGSPDSTNLASIASVTVDGEEQTEALVSDWLTQEVSQIQGYIELFSVDITDLYAAKNSVYAGLGFLYFAADENDQPMGMRMGRVIRIDASEVIQTVFEVTFDDIDSEISQTVFAADGSKAAFVTPEEIVIGDLTTGQQIAYATRKLESYWVRVAVRWLDNNRLLYCDAVDVWLLDTRDGTNTNLTADIEAPAWLIAQTNSN